MRRRTPFPRAMALLGAVAALALAETGPAAAQTYKFNSFMPPRAEVPRLVMEPFIKEVKEKTGGKLNFQMFAGGQLLGARETLAGVRDGIAEAGFVVPAFVVSSLPHANLLPDLLSFVKTAAAAAGATAETFLLDCPECQEDFAKMGSVTFGGYGTESYWLHCRHEVTSLADMSGKKVRVAGASSGRWAKAMGGVAVGGIPPTEISQAMQRGQVDCAIGVPVWLQSVSLGDSTKSVVTLPQGNYHGLSIFTFNRKFWDGLPRDQKAVALRAIANSIAYGTIQGTFVEDPQNVEKVIKAKRIKKTDGGPEFKKAWDEFLKTERTEVIAGAKQRGIDEAAARRIVDTHLKNVAKWEKIGQDVGTDVKKFADALWTEVYSKVKY